MDRVSQYGVCTMKRRLLLVALMVMTESLNAKTPKELGYTFPDEWGKHDGTMMIFPAFEGYGKQTEALRSEFRNIAKEIAKNEPVIVFCRAEEGEECREWLEGIKNLTIKPGDFRIDWARDNAPMVIVSKEGKKASAGFRFNGWGKKYRGWEKDVLTRDNIAREMKWPIFKSDYVLEGGSIEIGNGVGIVTESCVLNSNRTDWDKAKIEKELKDMLGLHKIVWLKSGLMPDKTTDGHVDGICKIIAKDTVLLHSVDVQSDVNYKICKEAKKVLQENGFKVIDLPLMDDIVHMNFYIGSGGDIIYVPVCGDPEQDDPALKVLRSLYPKVIPVKSVAIARAGGGIHCYTQQIPAGR